MKNFQVILFLVPIKIAQSLQFKPTQFYQKLNFLFAN